MKETYGSARYCKIARRKEGSGKKQTRKQCGEREGIREF
jgi:hypothetical protein